MKAFGVLSNDDYRSHQRRNAVYPKPLAVVRFSPFRLAEIELGEDVVDAIDSESNPIWYDGDRISVVSDRAYRAMQLALDRLRGRMRFLEAIVKNLTKAVAA